ncbi:hypothetical protein MKZ38_003856 [Zalerion maritima]|uniref:Uncharacterized protein n=1 Tax=Zalerion maritima TaxID=339359 RepID=A0AAD5WRF5_9PEZI|nr:hypothetical protein MKZ38_003856 [Zalerion maritima]
MAQPIFQSPRLEIPASRINSPLHDAEPGPWDEAPPERRPLHSARTLSASTSTTSAPATHRGSRSSISPRLPSLPSPRLGERAATWKQQFQQITKGSEVGKAYKFEPRHIHRTKAPLLMTVFFLVGLGMSIGHWVYYPGLSSAIVGDAAAQEDKIRFGTAFSFIAQIALTGAVWIAYTQWLWRTIRSTTDGLSVNCLNKGFNADTSPWSLLSGETMRKFKVGSMMAAVAWSLILPPFFTPATLFAVPSTSATEVVQQVPYLDIADSGDPGKYSYSPPLVTGTNKDQDTTRALVGPRTIISLLTAATASSGHILQLPAPSNRSSYAVKFCAPIVQCSDASTSQKDLIQDLLEEKMSLTHIGTAREDGDAYWGFQASEGSNQLWMTFLKYVELEDGAKTSDMERMYQTCQLYNSSYHLDWEWDHALQSVQGSYEILDAIDFPVDEYPEPSNLWQHAYSAIFWAVADEVVGSIYSPAQFDVIQTAIRSNSLLGSSSLDVYFDLDERKELYSDDVLAGKSPSAATPSPTNELSFNVTVSLMHNSLLTANTKAIVTHEQDVNCYGCSCAGLFVPYALSNSLTFVIVVLGLFSSLKDGVMPDKKFQDIIVTAEGIVILARDGGVVLTLDIVDGEAILRRGSEGGPRRKSTAKRWLSERKARIRRGRMKEEDRGSRGSASALQTNKPRWES